MSKLIRITSVVRLWCSLALALGLVVGVGYGLGHANVVQARPLLATLTVGTDCASIQQCIDIANDYDTVFITANSYTESLTLNKNLTLTGMGADLTILDGDANTYANTYADQYRDADHDTITDRHWQAATPSLSQQQTHWASRTHKPHWQ